MYDLLKKDAIWEFNDACELAFNELKLRLVKYPILRQPNFKFPFIVYTDASGFAVGGILAQADEQNNEYVCCYASRLLKGAEVHYGITEKECLAVVWAVKYFRIYLNGTKFLIVTDHSALKWLMTINDPTGRLARWSLYLQAYDFEIIHRKGKKHSNVDALSRPVLIGEKVKDILPEDISPKSLDPYEDDYLLYYLRHGKHKAGTSKKQVKRVLKEAEVFKWEDMMLKYKASPEEEEHNLIVPPKEERTDIVLRAHLLGHFQIQSTYNRLKEKYYWKNMIEGVKKVISKCLP